jgi:methionyl-tRNA formyltransferase
MKIAIIGRTDILYETACRLQAAGHEIVCILTAKEAPEYKRGAEDFRRLAEQWSVSYACSAKIIDYRDFLIASGADIAVSINYSGVIPSTVTDMFPLGILNAHGGDLPRYRGNACQAWAILNGEKRIGMCIHKMIGGELDSGDIIARDYMPINHTTKVGQVWAWMAERIPKLMIEAVDKLEGDPAYILERQSKDPRDALRCYPRKPEDGRIDWGKPAIDVLRLINASGKPYAGAFCDFEGQYLIIWGAELANDGEVFCAIPGQITALGERYVEVVCGAGKIRLLEIEMNGHSQQPKALISSIRKRLK